MITQELLKEHLEYRDGHLWWIKPTNRRIKISQQFGTRNIHGYRKATEHLHKEYANYG